MDVLTPTARRSKLASGSRRWILAALAISAYLGVVACMSLGSSERLPVFPHRIHTEDHQLSCTTCHSGARTAAEAGMPPPELCAPCHDEIDKGKPVERTVMGLFDSSGQWLGPKSLPLADEIRFSHDAHVARGLDCAACHSDPDAPRDTARPLLAKRDCMACHESQGASTACATCHTDVDQAWMPPSHLHNWSEHHGIVARDPSEASVDDCSLCHEPTSSCRTCHLTQAPRDHGNHFRRRGHGIAASIDRARCATCHTPDSCQQCHQVTRPSSHRAGFGGTASRHCGSCHLPVEDTGCATCHKATPSHDLATPLPPSHLPSMNCRACHGAGQPLPHPDGGHVCTSCHR